WDVIVVGAGPAGSATARLLARAGGRVLLLDRAHFPREKPCSEYLSPESTRVLERLGTDVLDAVAAAAPARLTGMKVVAPSGTGVVGRFETFSYALPRTTFDSILRNAAQAAGAEVREGVRVEDLIYERAAVGGVIARDTVSGKRETYRARVVVGAGADFFDRFTGQGIYSALRGAELAAAAIVETLATGTSLQQYARARRREFTGKWLLERLIGVAVGWPALIERVVGRLMRRPE